MVKKKIKIMIKIEIKMYILFIRKYKTVGPL